MLTPAYLEQLQDMALAAPGATPVQIGADVLRWLLEQLPAKCFRPSHPSPPPRGVIAPREIRACRVCGGTGRDPGSDNVNWLACVTCAGSGKLNRWAGL